MLLTTPVQQSLAESSLCRSSVTVDVNELSMFQMALYSYSTYGVYDK